MRPSAVLTILLPAAGLSRAGTSANYSTDMETTGMAAGTASSAQYTQTAQAGRLGGPPGKAIADRGWTYRNDPGAAGQYYRVLSIGFSPGSVTIPESSTVQAVPAALLDDDSTITAEQLFTWSTTEPSRTSVSASGLVSAGIYYGNWSFSTAARLEGVTGSFAISVTDADPDNFGFYAGDGLSDSWQVTYFGLNNSAARPAADPDGDGQDNLFEYRAQLIPTDPASRFFTEISIVQGVARITYGPVKAGTTYQVKYTPDLVTWLRLNSSPPTQTAGGMNTEFDAASAGNARRLYRVDVSR